MLTPADLWMVFPQVLLASEVQRIRLLDDVHGGSKQNLAYARRMLTVCGEFARWRDVEGRSAQERTFLSLCAQLAQAVGWLAFDAGERTVAQRHNATALDLAKVAKDHELAAYVASCMVHNEVYYGHAKEGGDLGILAWDLAKLGGPAVRSVVLARYAYAYASMPSEYAFRKAIEESRELLSKAGDDKPCYLYWFNHAMLDVIEAQSIIALSRASARNPHALLAESQALLGPRLDDDTLCPRDYALHGTWLAHTYVWDNEMDAALAVARRVLAVPARSRSLRVVTALHMLIAEMAERQSTCVPEPSTGEHTIYVC